jgi:ATP-dependent exoDNAse (exonuclease V) beta subunit
MVNSFNELTMMLLGHQRTDTKIEFGAQQVVLVRSDEARRNLPTELAASAIVLTVFESKGLEFDDVLLWDFFSASPCKKMKDGGCAHEWRTLYDYWMDNGGAETGNGSAEQRGDGLSAGSDDREVVKGLIPGSAPRRLAFDAMKHKLLESELKALYCAITRARVNIWIVDFDEEARKPAYTWFADSGLAQVGVHDSGTLCRVCPLSTITTSNPLSLRLLP